MARKNQSSGTKEVQPFNAMSGVESLARDIFARLYVLQTKTNAEHLARLAKEASESFYAVWDGDDEPESKVDEAELITN